jgi:hypothetical protein
VLLFDRSSARMDAASETIAPDLLGDWMTRIRRVAPRFRPPTDRGPGLRFIFYGRMSTVEYQDRIIAGMAAGGC